MTDAALRVGGVLHCKLNVRSLAAAVPVYEALGLTVRMRSRAAGQDSTSLGLPRLTDSEAWFLYDHRGGRGAPALELVEWTDPPTVGEAYGHPGEVGMQALGFAVPNTAEAVERVVEAGATVRLGGPDRVDATVVDVDGVALELTDADVPAGTFRYARLVCADPAATAIWYSGLGFEPTGAAQTRGWATADGGVPVGGVDVREESRAVVGPPGLELRLNGWPGETGDGRAHAAPNHRGLFRMALAVPDARAAVEAARDGGVEVGDPSWIPLPGTPLGGVWMAACRDPDGVLVELVEPTVAGGRRRR